MTRYKCTQLGYDEKPLDWVVFEASSLPVARRLARIALDAWSGEVLIEEVA